LPRQDARCNEDYSGGSYLYYDGHAGYDYRTTDHATDGRISVLAAADRTLSWGSSTYNTIYIDHRNGYRTAYLHLSGRDVPAGIPVVRGQPIGVSGSTGAAGPHLHFEVQNRIRAKLTSTDRTGPDEVALPGDRLTAARRRRC
jgi:murein DD-endopeptidase MepM/ murein hydrolase activator NlpD